MAKKKKCKTGFSCGRTCIRRSSTCRSNLDANGKKVIENYPKFIARIKAEQAGGVAPTPIAPKQKKEALPTQVTPDNRGLKKVAKVKPSSIESPAARQITPTPTKGKTPSDAEIDRAEQFRNRIAGDKSGATNIAARGLGTKVTKVPTGDMSEQVRGVEANPDAVQAIKDSGRNIVPVVALSNKIVEVDSGGTSDITVGAGAEVAKAISDANLPFARVLSVELADRRQADLELQGWDTRKNKDFALGQELESFDKIDSFEDGTGGDLSNTKRVRVPLNKVDSSAEPNAQITEMLKGKTDNIVAPIVFETSPGVYKVIKGDTLAASMKATGKDFGQVYVINNNTDKLQALKELGLV